jgi:hypothetical protein
MRRRPAFRFVAALVMLAFASGVLNATLGGGKSAAAAPLATLSGLPSLDHQTGCGGNDAR